MWWSTDGELQSTLERVRSHCSRLKKQAGDTTDDTSTEIIVVDEEFPDEAPGSKRDLLMHKDDEIYTDPVTLESLLKPLQGSGRSENPAQEGDKKEQEENAPSEIAAVVAETKEVVKVAGFATNNEPASNNKEASAESKTAGIVGAPPSTSPSAITDDETNKDGAPVM